MRCDHVAVLEGARRLHRRGDDVLVDAPALEHAQEHVLADAPGEEVGVERVDVRVGLGVVAEERLGRRPRGLAAPRRASRARREQRRQLVPELVADGAEAQAQQVLQVRLEREAVPDDAVEAQLVLEPAAHLLGRARQDVHAHARAHHLAQQRRRPGVGPLLVRAARARSSRGRAACRTPCAGTSCRGPSERCAWPRSVSSYHAAASTTRASSRRVTRLRTLLPHSRPLASSTAPPTGGPRGARRRGPRRGRAAGRAPSAGR